MKRYLTAREFAESGKLDPSENFKITFITDPYANAQPDGSPCEMEFILNLDYLINTDYGLGAHDRYRSEIRRYRKYYAHVLTKDNRFIRFSYHTNKKTRGWVLNYVYEPPKEAKCFYFCRVHISDYIELSEVALFEKLRKQYDDEEFYIYKISLVCKLQYPVILPGMSHWEKESLAAIEEDISLEKEDPDGYYLKYMQFTRWEGHTVQRDGTVISCCTVSEVDNYWRGYIDFMTPITFDEIYNSENPLFWSR